MLSWFRKHAKSNVVKGLYVFLAASFFTGFGILGNKYMKDREGPTRNSEAVLVVNGEDVSASEFTRAYAQAKQSWEARMEKLYGKVPEDMLDTTALKQDVMDQLVNKTIMVQEAKRLGVKVGDADVNAEIGRIPYFRDDKGKFDPDRYRNILNNLQVTPEEFEKEIREQLMVNRVINMIVAPVQVDDAELEAYYSKIREQIDLSFIMVDASERYKDLEATPAEIDDYYKNHSKEFDWPEMRKIKYLKFAIADYEKSVKVTDAQVKEFYEQAKDRYVVKESEGHFRHILIKLPENANDSEKKDAKEKADKVLAELKAGSDFAELAKKYSEDPGSAANGGDLGEQPRGTFIPEFEQAGYALQVGQISEPVLSKFGYHIIKLEALTPAEYQPLDKVKEEITKEVSRNQAHLAAKETADKVQKDCVAQGMDKCAAKASLKLYASDWIKKRDNTLEDVPESTDISEQSFYMNPSEVSEVISGVDDLYIIQVAETKDPHHASREEAYSRIKHELKPELQLKKTKEDARGWIAEMKKGATISEIAAKAGAKPKDTDYFEKSAKMVPELGLASEDFDKVIFNLDSKNPVADEPYTVGAKVYVLALKGDKPADMSKFAEEKDEVRSTLLEKKQQEAFDKFVAEKKQGKVTIKDEVYARIE